jgi:flagella basal body P-ring formation protein FlgA
VPRAPKESRIDADYWFEALRRSGEKFSGRRANFRTVVAPSSGDSRTLLLRRSRPAGAPIVAGMTRLPTISSFAIALLSCLATAAPAVMPVEAPGAGGAPAEALGERVQSFVRGELARSQPQLRADITVGELDARLHLAPCADTEVYLRPGTRLWGRSFVGYRCLQRPGWTVSIPVTVRLYGPALVATQALAALQPIAAGAVQPGEADVTREPNGVARDMEDIADRVLTRAIEPGQPIPLNALRILPAVNQGEPVKLVGTGNGFSIVTDGTAMSTAAPGELVRVRMESGRTIAGTARRGRVVEVSF